MEKQKKSFYKKDYLVFNSEGKKVGVICAKNTNEVLGVNSKKDLAIAESFAKKIKK